MKKCKVFLILTTMVCLVVGCATTKHKLKAGNNNELVVCEGIAPIINNDLQSAKKTSLDDALKNALGLVVGIYVSQESLVSKSMLIEDNIVSQTEGYVEKYDIIKESFNDSFYKTTIKALVRKEDLLTKMKSLDLTTEKDFKPIISINIDENIDNKTSETKYAENELKKFFISKDYKIHLKDYADIIITGKINTSYDKDFGNLPSYQANISLTTSNIYGQEISNEQTSVGGAGVTKEVASKTSCQNAIIKVREAILKDIDKYTNEKTIAYMYITKIGTVNQLNSLINTLRTMIEIKDCLVRKYDKDGSLIELYLKYPDFEKLITKLKNMEKIKITHFDSKNISAEYIGK